MSITTGGMDYIVAPDRHDAGDFIVRSYLPGDGPRLQEAAVSSYEHLKTFMYWATPAQTVEEAEHLVRMFRGRYLLATDFTLAILAPDESELLGGCGYHLREGALASGNAEIGMWIRASRAAQGLGTKALGALLAWGFSEWPWRRLSWRCDTRNLASIRVAEKAGMEREGVARADRTAPDGSIRDTVCFSALR